MEFKNVKNANKEIFELGITRSIVTAISINKKIVFLDAAGKTSSKTNKDTEIDDQFRVFSLSKIVTAVTAMRLYERGLFSLDDKISKYIPEFKEGKCLKEKSFLFFYEHRKNELTIRNLLTMTSGIPYGQFPNGPNIKTSSIHLNWNSKKFIASNDSCLKLAKKIAKIPTMFQPGKKWYYGMSFEVLSGIIEVVTNKPFVEVVKEEVLDVVGMPNTAFWFKNKEKATDLIFNYLSTKNKILQKMNRKVIHKSTFIGEVQERNCVQAGGSLVSTVEDYIKFLSAMIDGKTIEGKVLLKPDTLKLMTTTHSFFTNNFFKKMSGLDDKDYAYGFGVRVRRSNTTRPFTNKGEFGWNSIGGSYAVVDPKLKMCAVNFLSGFPARNKVTDVKFVEALYADLRKIK